MSSIIAEPPSKDVRDQKHPMEKLLRDARACLIADGCNEVLALKGGGLLVNPDLL